MKGDGFVLSKESTIKSKVLSGDTRIQCVYRTLQIQATALISIEVSIFRAENGYLDRFFVVPPGKCQSNNHKVVRDSFLIYSFEFIVC